MQAWDEVTLLTVRKEKEKREKCKTEIGRERTKEKKESVKGKKEKARNYIVRKKKEINKEKKEKKETCLWL